MSEHTKGPWRLDYPDGWGGAFVETTQPVADGRTALICSLYDRQSAFPPDDDEKEANGRLIAAAPDILAALVEAEVALSRCEFAGARAMDGGIGAIDAALVVVRAAIAKATKGQQ